MVDHVTPSPEQRLAEPAELERLLALAATAEDPEGRFDLITRELMERPYLADSLVGGPEEPEQVVTRLDAFDCVTFCDVVYALAGASSPESFHARIVALRYHHGEVGWRSRNHYTHSWLERNVGARLLTPLLLGLWRERGAPRTLNVVPGYPSVSWQPRFLPWTRRASLEACARTGDWVGFISNRGNLDTFHVGVLVIDGELCVRHASRSRGRVIQEPLTTCMADWEVPGLLLARPLPPSPAPGGRP